MFLASDISVFVVIVSSSRISISSLRHGLNVWIVSSIEARLHLSEFAVAIPNPLRNTDIAISESERASPDVGFFDSSQRRGRDLLVGIRKRFVVGDSPGPPCRECGALKRREVRGGQCFIARLIPITNGGEAVAAESQSSSLRCWRPLKGRGCPAGADRKGLRRSTRSLDRASREPR